MFQPSSLFSCQLWLQPLDTPCHFCLLLPVHFCFTSSLCDKLPTSFKTLAVLRNGPNSLALIPLASKFYVPSCSILVSLAIASTNGFEQKWLHEISKVGLEKSCSFLWFSWNLCARGRLFSEMPPLRLTSWRVRSPMQIRRPCVHAPAHSPRQAALVSHHSPSQTCGWRSL